LTNRLIFGLCFMTFLSLGCGAQKAEVDNGTSPDKTVTAKDDLSKKLLSDPSILGVGVGSNSSSGHSKQVLYVYVSNDASDVTLNHIPRKYKGIPVSIVKTEPFKAQ
jgi:hypothetical protein